MFTRKFFAWVGIGLMGAVAIPALAAPHLAKYAQRRNHVTTRSPSRVTAKPAVKAPTTKPAAAKSTLTKTASVITKRPVTTVRSKPAKTLTPAPRTTSPQSNASKSRAITPAARRLLH